MPGQRKRKRQQVEEHRRRVDAHAGWQWHSAGWFADPVALRERVRLLCDHHPLDEAQLRIDNPCTRVPGPSSTHLQVLLPPGQALGPDGTTVVPAPAPVPAPEEGR
ncbi:MULTISPECIES: hypothetical protein [Kitasatospora]|uniref:Uncharacterized protein n=1 Tax=Kitasatospora setae (strain ATCC 33774 / DSM 43861 / JCM 3304 / KCC A-0304 / NBRC 14216 / KM-6054) TaxID=452652 RepID=E4N1U3_KITSK|nr:MULTISPECIES: hypothetical protein [Kitasatospora]BAJ32127.1 hypothetical protein KSE_63690 [Kitasatospora setae KM-6054]